MAHDILLPDTGSNNAVDIIEIHVKAGVHIEKGAPLVTLESDKATIDVPAPETGKVIKVLVKVGQKVRSGEAICQFEGEGATEKPTSKPATSPKAETSSAPAPEPEKPPPPTSSQPPTPLAHAKDILAGPAVRRLARVLGVDLTNVTGTGQRNRVTQEDVQSHVKNILTRGEQQTSSFALPAMPEIDFAQYGPIKKIALTRIKRVSAQNLSRNWLLAPHVTQFDEADITELEAFRKKESSRFEKQGFKLTPLVFIMKAIVAALKAFPSFNASLDSSGENLILKEYFHLGIAVDTPEGLVVPVIRDVDQKSFTELAKELAEMSHKAREKKLTAQNMQGNTFTISSLGGIGGTAFTPIINLPDVAILGVSKSTIKPIYNDYEFQPRLMLPLSLSYDHRVIDGAEAARFIVFLSGLLSDIKKLLL